MSIRGVYDPVSIITRPTTYSPLLILIVEYNQTWIIECGRWITESTTIQEGTIISFNYELSETPMINRHFLDLPAPRLRPTAHHWRPRMMDAAAGEAAVWGRSCEPEGADMGSHGRGGGYIRRGRHRGFVQRSSCGRHPRRWPIPPPRDVVLNMRITNHVTCVFID
jgi:hypothetical protein